MEGISFKSQEARNSGGLILIHNIIKYQGSRFYLIDWSDLTNKNIPTPELITYVYHSTIKCLREIVKMRSSTNLANLGITCKYHIGSSSTICTNAPHIHTKWRSYF